MSDSRFQHSTIKNNYKGLNKNLDAGKIPTKSSSNITTLEKLNEMNRALTDNDVFKMFRPAKTTEAWNLSKNRRSDKPKKDKNNLLKDDKKELKKNSGRYSYTGFQHFSMASSRCNTMCSCMCLVLLCVKILLPTRFSFFFIAHFGRVFYLSFTFYV